MRKGEGEGEEGVSVAVYNPAPALAGASQSLPSMAGLAATSAV